jgi:hypothetical protein
VKKVNIHKKDREGMRRQLEECERTVRDKQQKQRVSSDAKRITSSNRSKSTETNIDAEYVLFIMTKKRIILYFSVVMLLMNHLVKTSCTICDFHRSFMNKYIK